MRIIAILLLLCVAIHAQEVDYHAKYKRLVKKYNKLGKKYTRLKKKCRKLDSQVQDQEETIVDLRNKKPAKITCTKKHMPEIGYGSPAHKIFAKEYGSHANTETVEALIIHCYLNMIYKNASNSKSECAEIIVMTKDTLKMQGIDMKIVTIMRGLYEALPENMNQDLGQIAVAWMKIVAYKYSR